VLLNPQKGEEAKGNHIRMDNLEESKPPRWRYSLCLVTKVTLEKQTKAKEVATQMC